MVSTIKVHAGLQSSKAVSVTTHHQYYMTLLLSHGVEIRLIFDASLSSTACPKDFAVNSSFNVCTVFRDVEKLGHDYE